MITTRKVFGLAAVVALGVIGIVGPSVIGPLRPGLARVDLARPEAVPGWIQRIALVDDALARSDLRRAIYQWREARGAALRIGRPEGLLAVGERAIRIANLAGGSGYFLREAKEVYVHAALRARAERSRDTILGIAEAFEQLGDTDRAKQVRRIAASTS